DGLVDVTGDGGKSWQHVTPNEMPEWGRVRMIDASPQDAGTAYIAVDKHELDDWAPYAFKTSDFGKTWTKITNGLPQGALVHVVREDPVRKGLLFAGTELGIYVSFDDGAAWQNSLQRNLPTTQIADLIIKNNDIVAATHGRAFWVLDDIAPLRQYAANNNEEAVLYKPAPALRARGAGFEIPSGRAVGQNPPAGAVIYYFLKTGISPQPAAGGAAPAGSAAGAAAATQRPRQETTLEVTDGAGKLVRKFSNLPRPEDGPTPDEQETAAAFRRGGAPNRLPAEQGLNRFVWNLRYDDATRVPNSPLWAGGTAGPLILPATYPLKFTAPGNLGT